MNRRPPKHLALYNRARMTYKGIKGPVRQASAKRTLRKYPHTQVNCLIEVKHAISQAMPERIVPWRIGCRGLG